MNPDHAELGPVAQRPIRVASDTGGTFTDLVDSHGRILKVLSTPDDPGVAVRRGVRSLHLGVGDDDSASSGAATEVLAHGTTVATNALLERRGAQVGLVTTAGFADVIEIGRQDRPSLYDQSVDRPEPLVVRDHRYEVIERLEASGSQALAVEGSSLGGALASGVDAMAVCLLHSDLDPSHEEEVAQVLSSAGFDVTRSSEVSPEMREYERTCTTVVNAYLRPICRDYLRNLGSIADRVLVMTSAGGLVPAGEAAEKPASLLLSGPAGGVLAGAAAASANGYPGAVTFDMGGTSTDVCLVLDGQPAPAAERVVAGLPVRLPSLDVHTIGAGGGSIARLDSGGALAVGPVSAGSVPGPACYGLGGSEPTVTDADLVAGRLPAGVQLPGLGELDLVAASRALAAAGAEAEGVISVVEANMAQAIRAVTVEQGVDPRELALVAFGGAGPLHACALADALDMECVIVPARAGVLSAVGILGAPQQVDLVRSWPDPLDHEGLHEAIDSLASQARAQLLSSLGPTSPTSSPITVATALDCRYAGQSHELRVGSVEELHGVHERRNGYRRDGHPVEVIALRATASLASPVDLDDLPVPQHRRDLTASGSLVGPLALAEPDCTVWIPEGWVGTLGEAGALVLRRSSVDVEHHPEGLATEASGRPSQLRPGSELDPASLQILVGKLKAVADEMGAVLRRAAFSPNIKERADCSAALFTADGEMLVQAEHIPVHLGSMPASVRSAIEAFPHTGRQPPPGSGERPAEPRGVRGGSAALLPGDQVIVNDPFAGGTHLNDVTLVAPCFVDGHLVGWAANRAHHADVGGAAPGSLPADATEIFQEGLRIPPVLLTDEVRRLLLANSRTPEERAGDLDAQIGANVLGVSRLLELVEELTGGARGKSAGSDAGSAGVADVAAAHFSEVLAYGERRMRAELSALPDGTWRFEDVIDSFGPEPDQQQPGKIVVTLTIEGDEVTFDFEGTDPQRRGNVNAVEAVTVSSAVFALRCAADPTIPANGGALRPLRVIATAGTIVNARPPTAVGAGNVEVSQRVSDACLGALGQAVPGRVGAASQGTMNNLLIGGDGWVYYETVGGGQGGRPPGSSRSGAFTQRGEGPAGEARAGQSAIHTGMTNTRNTPCEALERAFPMRVLRYRIRGGSGGAGRARGGDGIERDLQVLEDVTVSLITERRVSQPWGLAGGEPGAVGENWLLPGGDEARAERLPDKCTIRLRSGDVLRMLTPGGGGWGQLG